MLRYFSFEPSFKLRCVVLEIYLEHKFQWPQEGLKYYFLSDDVLPNPLKFNPNHDSYQISQSSLFPTNIQNIYYQCNFFQKKIENEDLFI